MKKTLNIWCVCAPVKQPKWHIYFEQHKNEICGQHRPNILYEMHIRNWLEFEAKEEDRERRMNMGIAEIDSQWNKVSKHRFDPTATKIVCKYYEGKEQKNEIFHKFVCIYLSIHSHIYDYTAWYGWHTEYVNCGV